jgi:hypothetical protein
MTDIHVATTGTGRRRPLRRRRLHDKSTIAALSAIVVLAAGLAWFQPYKLLVDDTVTEQLAGRNVELARATFRSLEHATSGTAIVYATADGQRLLRLADLDTSNGPDLRVVLSSAPLSDSTSTWGDDYVEIARLKGNVGSQNYVLPAGVDLARYGRVVIWCDRFDVGFAVADIAAA